MGPVKINVFYFILFSCILGLSFENGTPAPLDELTSKLSSLKNALTTLQERLGQLSESLAQLKTDLSIATQEVPPTEELSELLIEAATYGEIPSSHASLLHSHGIFVPENKIFLKKHYQIPEGTVARIPQNQDLNKILEDDKLLEGLFPELVKRNNGLFRIKNIIRHFAHKIENYSYQGLGVCACPNFQLPTRFIITMKQANDILKQYPNKSTTIVHTSFGAGDLLQLYFLTFTLIQFGYTHLILNAIDLAYEKTNVPAITAFKQLVNPYKNIRLQQHNFVQEYIRAIWLWGIKEYPEYGERKSHSFDMIDIGGVSGPDEPILFQISKDDNISYLKHIHYVIKVKKNVSADGISSEHLHTIMEIPFHYFHFQSKKNQLYLYLSPDQKIIILKSKSVSTETDNLINDLVSIPGKDLTSKKIIKTILSSRNSFVTKEDDQKKLESVQRRSEKALLGLNRKRKEIFSLTLHHALDFEFFNLVNETQINESPIVYIGTEQKIKKFPSSIPDIIKRLIKGLHESDPSSFVEHKKTEE